MKKGIFLLATLLAFGTSVQASDINKSTIKIGVNYNYSDAVSFVERGVKFHVFLNGEFDFNTHYRNTKYVDTYGRRTNTKYNRGFRIERDFNGRVRRVGNTFINYDIRGNVNRIGNIYMNYRFGQLTRVGNLTVEYDRWGSPRFYGDVKYNDRYNDDYYHNDGGVRIDIRLGDVCDYNDAYFFRNDFRRNYSQIREDNNFFYYRAKQNAKVGKRGRILKRRKPANKTYQKKAYQNKSYTKKGLNTYRKTDTNRRTNTRKGKEVRKPSNRVYKNKVQEKSINKYRKSDTKKVREVKRRRA